MTLSAEKIFPMCPQKNQLHGNKCAGVNHILLAKKCLHQRNHQNPRIGINAGCLLNHIQLKQLLQRYRNCKEQNMNCSRCDCCEDQAPLYIRRTIHLKCMDDHARNDKIHQDNRDTPAVGCLHQACLHNGIPHEHDHEQLHDLLHEQ